MIEAVRAGLRGERPARYEGFPYTDHLFDAIGPHVVPGVAILDVGSGAAPTLPPEWHPDAARYVGLDVSRAELERAPEGFYDQIVVGDVTVRDPALEDSFDLVLSVNTFEHVRPLDVAVENLRAYLRPGGVLIAQFAGSRSFFALLNRIVPERLKERSLERLTGRSADDVFPARYHLCRASALRRRVFAGWSALELRPLFLGADYLEFSRPLAALYLGYEAWAAAGAHEDLATHYLVIARR